MSLFGFDIRISNVFADLCEIKNIIKNPQINEFSWCYVNSSTVTMTVRILHSHNTTSAHKNFKGKSSYDNIYSGSQPCTCCAMQPEIQRTIAEPGGKALVHVIVVIVLLFTGYNARWGPSHTLSVARGPWICLFWAFACTLRLTWMSCVRSQCRSCLSSTAIWHATYSTVMG